jgi:hypothetical protein
VPLNLERNSSGVVRLLGVNGSGKTTTAAKLASLKGSGKRVILAAADTFRAAAIEQLERWGERIQVEVIRQAAGSDPAAVVFDAVKAATARDLDVLIVDTAGRLHTKTNLMDELAKLRRVIERQLPGAPHETLMVLDAPTGQNGFAQARMFHEAIGLTGVCLTKLDGTAKGGIVIRIVRELKVPVKLIGLGEARGSPAVRRAGIRGRARGRSMKEGETAERFMRRALSWPSAARADSPRTRWSARWSSRRAATSSAKDPRPRRRPTPRSSPAGSRASTRGATLYVTLEPCSSGTDTSCAPRSFRLVSCACRIGQRSQSAVSAASPSSAPRVSRSSSEPAPRKPSARIGVLTAMRERRPHVTLKAG